jgi:hypothetical protein
MPFKKYIATKDTTITNAYKPDLINRATDANMGASDSLEMFSIFAQASTSSVEKSRILVEFPISDILNDRNTSKIPASGSVSFILRLFNVEHPFSVPKDYTASIHVVSQNWDEGYGLDMESYSDAGWASGSKGGSGCTWLYATSGSKWSNEGGFFSINAQDTFNYTFKTGLEDVELDITNLVERWITGSTSNYGLILKLSDSFEDGTNIRSFYTKKFSARGSEFFYKRPAIEARWEAIVKDDRGQFFASSSLLESEDNIMNLYFYNKVSGISKNIAGNFLPSVKFYTNPSLTSEVSSAFLEVTNPSAGVYKAAVSINTTASVLYDFWYNTSSLDNIFSSSFDVLQRQNYDYEYLPEYIININNLKVSYSENETAKFKIFVREKDWQPTIYTVASNLVENSIIPDLYYKIFRLSDNYLLVDYSTGSLAYTKTSYDSNGNYFDLDMKNIEKGYVYGVKLARWNGLELVEFKNVFKFKVE